MNATAPPAFPHLARLEPRPLPPHQVERLARELDREQGAFEALRRARVAREDPRVAQDLHEVQNEIEHDQLARGRRRQAELDLADYIEHVALYHPIAADLYGFRELVESMRKCRQTGTFGRGPDGGWIIQWDHKCGQVRLCPDEARGESRRVAERYVPAMLEWQRERPGRRRLFYAVFTVPNVLPGQLREGKRAAFQRFREIVFGEADACPVEFRRGQAVRPNRRRKMRRFPSVKGAHLTQEDPLSAHDDWNVHINALLLVDGEISFKRLRDEWGYQLEIRQLKGNEAALRSAVVECVKYAALAVPSKAREKREAGESRAPAVVEWPFERFIEWWAAGNGFRRSRALGALYDTPKPELRPAEDVDWCGVIEFDGLHYQATVGISDARNRLVGSIPMENKFRTSGRATGPDPPPGRPTSSPGPP